MLGSPTCNRRTMLCLMGSALTFISLSLMFPVKSVAKALRRLPGSLALLPLHHDLFRQARGHMLAHSFDPRTYQAAQTYLRDPDSPVALDRFEHQVHQDFVAGRVAVVDGWVLSETEMALLSIVKRPL